MCEHTSCKCKMRIHNCVYALQKCKTGIYICVYTSCKLKMSICNCKQASCKRKMSIHEFNIHFADVRRAFTVAYIKFAVAACLK